MVPVFLRTQTRLSDFSPFRLVPVMLVLSQMLVFVIIPVKGASSMQRRLSIITNWVRATAILEVKTTMVTA
jgi:hypothetical protein